MPCIWKISKLLYLHVWGTFNVNKSEFITLVTQQTEKSSLAHNISLINSIWQWICKDTFKRLPSLPVTIKSWIKFLWTLLLSFHFNFKGKVWWNVWHLAVIMNAKKYIFITSLYTNQHWQIGLFRVTGSIKYLAISK